MLSPHQPARETRLLDVLIQTYNEQANLRHTLASVSGWAHRIFVVDSGSTDGTVALAQEYGATVVQHDFIGYAQQKNWALDNLPFESPWILIIDADERVTPELRQDIQNVVSRPPDEVAEDGFYINRVLIFMGRQIWHCGYYPSWNLRLFKRGRMRYEDRLVHEHMIGSGKTGYLKHLLLHEDRRGLEHFFAKHNRYSTLEAREIFEAPERWLGWKRLLTDRTARRRFLKSRVVPHVPLPWLGRFVYMYVLKLGFLDGLAGWKLCWFISFYEFLIQMKFDELQRVRGARSSVSHALKQPEGHLSREQELGVTQTATNGRAALPGVASAESPDATGEVGAEATKRLAARAMDAYAPQTAAVDTGLSVSVGEPIAPPGPPRRRVGRVPVSVIIPTLNEGKNLRRCLDHLEWADEVLVVDSGSSDDTVAIAHEYGAKVVNFRWNGHWPKKKNWALREAPLTHEWVLIVDADEWIVPELAGEIERVLKNPAGAGYYVNRRFIFMGRWIKHCGYYPSWNLRLIQRGQGEYEQLTGVGNTGSGDNEVHEHVVPAGEVSYLKNDMLHLAFPSIYTFMEKHNRYSNWEAAVQYRKLHTSSAAIGAELSKRRKLKDMSRALPFRPTLRFLYSYLWMGGIFDGQPGYVFCRLLAIYEYLSVAKYIEMSRHEDDEKAARQLSYVPPADLTPADASPTAPLTAPLTISDVRP